MRTINIDGIEYGLVPVGELKKEPLDINFYYEAIYEDSDYCIKASVFIKDEPAIIDTESLLFEITDKRSRGKWIDVYWDNIDWIRKLHSRELEHMEFAESNIGKSGIDIILNMLDTLKEKGWF